MDTGQTPTHPAVFVGHAAPNMVARDDTFTRTLQGLARNLDPKPRSVLAVSSHWTSMQLSVTASSSGPHAPYELLHEYEDHSSEPTINTPLHGSPWLVNDVTKVLGRAGKTVIRDTKRGLDHGVWVPLSIMWADGPPPVVQISLPKPARPAEAFALGRALAPLKEDSTLILASGGTVHNLGALGREGDPVHPWAAEFNEWLLDQLVMGRHDALFDYRKQAPHAAWAAPNPEPMACFFVAMGAASDCTSVEVLNHTYLCGSLSMLSLRYC